MNEHQKKGLTRLAIFAAIVLGGLLIGGLTGQLKLVTDIYRAIVLLLAGLTILVTIHELGHFLTAKAFGMRVETFSIGFPPTLFSWKKGETDYQIGATPLGGYVKITGIIDESLDTDYLKSEPKPWEFRSKPIWQRIIVMTGGVIMNVLLGILIFSSMKLAFGEVRIPMSEVKYGIEVPSSRPSLGSIVGFKTRDTLVSFMGQSFTYLEEYANMENLLENGAYFEVIRQGQKVRLDVPIAIQNQFSNDSIDGQLFLPNVPAKIRVADSTNGGPGPAFAAGLRSGDQIIQLDSVPVFLFSDLRAYMSGKKLTPVEVQALRGGDTISITVVSDTNARLGVAAAYGDIIHADTVNYSLWGAIGAGTREAFGFISSNAKGMGNMFREGVDASRSAMGPLQIAKVFLESFDRGGIIAFLRLTAILSMILAFVNILPIPALDGGHVVFLLIEAVMRREPPVRVRIAAQQIGMFIILGLMILILFNDAFRLMS